MQTGGRSWETAGAVFACYLKGAGARKGSGTRVAMITACVGRTGLEAHVHASLGISWRKEN